MGFHTSGYRVDFPESNAAAVCRHRRKHAFHRLNGSPGNDVFLVDAESGNRELFYRRRCRNCPMAAVHLRPVVCENLYFYHSAGLRQLLSGDRHPREKRCFKFARLVPLGVATGRGDIPVSHNQDLGIRRETLPFDGELKII